MFSVLTFLPQFIETPRSACYGFGSSITIAGVTILPMLVTMAAGGMLSGPVHHVFGFKAQLACGSAFLGTGSLGFALWNSEAWKVMIGCAVFGLGLGLAYSAMTSVIVQAVAPAQTGSATGMNTNIRNIGGGIGTAVVTAVITATARPGGLATAGGYVSGGTILAAIAGVAVAASLLIPSARRAAARRGDNARGSGPAPPATH
jgi:MFS family permease